MCLGYRILYRFLPVTRLRAWIIRHHFSDCPRCKARFILADRIVAELSATPDWIGREHSLWPSIHDRITSEAQPRPTIKAVPRGQAGGGAWRWAVAGLSLALVVSVNLLIRRDKGPEAVSAAAPPAETAPDVTVNFAEVKGGRAHHYIYRTSSKSYIWFVRNKDSGGE